MAKMSGVILLPLYASNMTLDEYGLFALFEVIFEILVAISDWGLNIALPRWYYSKEAKGRQKGLFFTAFIFLLLSAFIFMGGASFLLINSDKLIFSVQVSNLIIIVFLLSCFTRIIMQFPLLLMRVQQKALKQTTINIIYLVLVVSLTVLFLSVLKLKLIGIFYAQLISSGIISLILLPYIIKNISIKIEFSLLREMLKFSTPVLFSTMLTLVLTLSDRYILAYFGSLADTGEYQLAYKISNVIKLLLVQSFMFSFAPLYYKDMEKTDTSRFYTKTLTYFIYFSVFLSLGLTLFSREILTIFSLNNADYINAYKVIPILVFGVVFSGVRQFVALPLFKHKMTKITATVSVFAGVVNLILNILIIPYWGVFGAAATTSFTHFMVIIIYSRIAKKVEKIKFEEKKFLEIFLLGIVLFLLSYLILDIAIYMRIAMKIILLAMFPIILYWLRFYEKVEIDKIRGAWKKWKNIFKLRENIISLQKSDETLSEEDNN